MNKFKLSIELKQHTPLIHFQHEQTGATLRATEVKPTFDRFILSRLGRSGEYEDEGRACYQKSAQGRTLSDFDSLSSAEKGKWKAEALHWFIGNGEQDALNYKMRIEAGGLREEFLIASSLNTENLTNTPAQVTIISQSPYFAQEKENSSIVKKIDSVTRDFKTELWDKLKMKGVMHEKVSVEIFSLHDKLLKRIEKEVEAFFVCHNFGTRQNKGFGSFTVQSINGCSRHRENYDAFIAREYDFIYKRNNCRPASQWVNGRMDFDNRLFSQIKSDYQLLKAGLNFPKYKKSLLFCYCVTCCKGNPRWEKRRFKQVLQPYVPNGHRIFPDLNGPLARLNCRLKGGAPVNDEKGNRSWLPDPSFNYSFVRALLGVAEQYEFLCDSGSDGKKEIKAVVKVQSDEGIERFQSPLLFKVIDKAVYLVGNEIDSNLLEKTFRFEFFLGKPQFRNKPVKENGKTIIKSEKVFVPEKLELSGSTGNSEQVTLQVPADFSLKKFMEYAMNCTEDEKRYFHYQPVESTKR